MNPNVNRKFQKSYREALYRPSYTHGVIYNNQYINPYQFTMSHPLVYSQSNQHPSNSQFVRNTQQMIEEPIQIPEQGLCKQVFTAIYAAIIGEATAIDFYTRLAKVAPDLKHKADILHALEDEKKHLKKFTALYTKLTGQIPKYTIEPVQFESYKEGLEMAYRDELEAYEDYRDAYLLTQNLTVRDVFLLGYSDEIEHAIRFGFLMQSL
ncbi:ferritin-like domain-containing protein [Chengkuizengella sediminis]|uniref:ferritin-like domain-containing protein n=1 Tax=Chengkuizengella sediminis TaxID=1885917 RepID=UPI001F10E3B4|nr:ferritin-like domain-containing protein [Chengkuizengella sediminis]